MSARLYSGDRASPQRRPRHPSVVLTDKMGWRDSPIEPLEPELELELLRSAPYLDPAFRVFVTSNAGLATLRNIFASRTFGLACFEARRRAPPPGDCEIPVVVAPAGLAGFGRACDWPDGVAAQVLEGRFTVVVVSFQRREPGASPVSRMPPLLHVAAAGSSTSTATTGSQSHHRQLSRACELAHSLVAAGYSEQGGRPSMEDEHVIVPDLLEACGRRQRDGDPPFAFFAVFDGHNGREVVEKVARDFHRQLAADEHFPRDLERALRSTYRRVEAGVLEESTGQRWESGTTAVTLVLHRDVLSVAHVGDSRAVLCRCGRAVELTRDHDPADPDEQRRIERDGGFVSAEGYVSDLLAVARAFGDLDQATGRKIVGVSCEPDVSTQLLEVGDEFLLLACDGLFDKFSNTQAVEFVRRSLMRHADAQLAAQELVTEALRRETTDNVSVIIVAFHKHPGFAWHTSLDSPSAASGLGSSASSSGASGERPRLQLTGLATLKAALSKSK